ncbi:MAG: hypothetical protein LBQ08_01925 [Holosporaceae bacterium]|nr:hypothetical protein [Holosporaceae bacterium]
MKKILCVAVAVIGMYGVSEGMQFDLERTLNIPEIKARDIPEYSGSTHTGFVQGNTFVFTCAVDLGKLCDDIIVVLSDESKYSPDVNDLLRNENLLKYDDFPGSLNFISLLYPFLPSEKRTNISKIVPQVEEFILKQYTGLCTEYSGFIELSELFLVESFFFRRLQALQRFPK